MKSLLIFPLLLSALLAAPAAPAARDLIPGCWYVKSSARGVTQESYSNFNADGTVWIAIRVSEPANIPLLVTAGTWEYFPAIASTGPAQPAIPERVVVKTRIISPTPKEAFTVREAAIVSIGAERFVTRAEGATADDVTTRLAAVPPEIQSAAAQARKSAGL